MMRKVEVPCSIKYFYPSFCPKFRFPSLRPDLSPFSYREFFFSTMHFSLRPTGNDAPGLTQADFNTFCSDLVAATKADNSCYIFDQSTKPLAAVQGLLALPCVSKFLIHVSRVDVFSQETAESFGTTAGDLSLLRSCKLLKYSYSLPCGQIVSRIASIVSAVRPDDAESFTNLADRVLDDSTTAKPFLKHFVSARDAPSGLVTAYKDNAEQLIESDPHAVYPTSVYRQSFGYCTSTDDSCVIEGIMGTTITTTIQIVRDVLAPSSQKLREVYKPLGRCIAVVDERLDGLYGKELEAYFKAHNIELIKLAYRCMEVDKDISTVEQILVDLKKARVSRNEPVLIMGGGVMADVGGFACALYHRNTPYVMLCTSIVSGIDAGPSPRTCCDGLGYKNVFGSYHPPILTLTDRQFFKTLKPGWIRHGIAEIIKMAVTKDSTLFDDVEEAGNRLVETKFGIENCERGSDIDALSERIIAKAMDGYVRSEYGNLWETHQCRPHAYGHTWSPGFELQAGLLHGHAVAIGMGYGAYLSYIEGWITEEEFHRILRVMSNIGLSLCHDILENTNSIWSAQVKMSEKRGGNLCAPVPRGSIGKCGYINDMTRERLEKTLLEYQEIVKKYPRNGLGVESHCADVGLEDPSTVKQHAENAVKKEDYSKDTHANGSSTESGLNTNGINGAEMDPSNIDKYNFWLEKREKAWKEGKVTSSALGASLVSKDAKDMPNAPKFDHDQLFHDMVEEYASRMTTLSSDDFLIITEETEKAGLYAPCMVGKLEGQFLKMIARLKKARRVLDIGTFTGFSALAFAEAVPEDGEVVTIEADAKTAKVAQICFKRATHGKKIKLLECDARAEVDRMADAGEKFDIVFLDADKTNYRHYYEAGLRMIDDEGVLMADNALCSLVYSEEDPARQSLHEFTEFVRKDDRVEQVMLTVREGILVVQKRG